MRVGIYSLSRCKDCSEYHKIVEAFCDATGVPFEIIDLDLEKHVKCIVEYRLTFIPSTLFFANDDRVLVNKGGLLSLDQLYESYYDAIFNS